MAVWRGIRADPGGGPSTEYYSFHGAICGRCSDRTAWNAGYEAADQYALFYPDRRPMHGKKLDFYELGSISFEKPDMETFTGLKLALSAMKKGGSMPTVYNAANEKAVSLFLNRKITYLQIPELIEEAMDQHKVIPDPSVEQILETEKQVYEFLNKEVQQ